MSITSVNVTDRWDVENGYAELSIQIILDEDDVELLRRQIEIAISDFVKEDQ